MFSNVDGGRFWISSPDTFQGARRRCFLALMVDDPESTALTPPRGVPSMFVSIDGGRFWIYNSDTS
jgi:hypothetical protein